MTHGTEAWNGSMERPMERPMEQKHGTSEENIYTTTNIYTSMELRPPITLPYVFGATVQCRELYQEWIDTQKKLSAVDGRNRSRKIGSFFKTNEWKRAYHTWRLHQLRSFLDEVNQVVGHVPMENPTVQAILQTIERSEKVIK